MEQAELLTLIEKCRQGDPAAQETLIKEAQDRVYYHCKKFLQNEADAQDAAQDVLITMLTSLDKLCQPAAFWGWLNGITANRCKHLLSRGPREWQIPEDEEGNSMLDSLETLDDQAVPDKVIDTAETRRLILDIIDGLPPEQRMTVTFFYYDEMSVRDIAQAMEVSEGTVKSRLNYARKSIKDRVEKLAKQGTKLYGVSPLPFLAYFLRANAQEQALSPAAAAALTQGTLAASGGTAAAAATATTTASAATAAAAGAKAAGAVSGKLIAAALAGTLAVGGIGTGAYLATHQEPGPTPSPTPVMEAMAPISTAEPDPMAGPVTTAEPDLTAEPGPTEEPATEATASPEPTGEPGPSPEATAEPTPSVEPSGAPTPTPEATAEPTPEPTPEPNDLTIENGVVVKYNGPGGAVTVPDGVTAIGPGAFADCSTVTSVTLPGGVTKIDTGAFFGCSRLAQINLPGGITVIGDRAFYHCSALTSLTLPSSLTTLGESAVCGCSGLSSITIPSGVTTLKSYVFAYCTGLREVTIPASVSTVSTWAFGGCSGLHTLTLAGSGTTLSDTALEGCSGLTVYGPAGEILQSI